jgi:serine/threonine protein kinase
METSGSKMFNTSSNCDVVDEEMFQTQAETPLSSNPSNSVYMIDDRYVLLKLLGEGAFGAWFNVYDKQEHQILALKMPKDESFQPMFRREIEIMENLSQLQEENKEWILEIIEYNLSTGVIKSDSNVVCASNVSYFTSNYAKNGDLATYIIKNNETFRKGLQESSVFGVFSQILNGIETIHESGLVHLDLKPDNILLFDDFKVAVADFALAKDIRGEDQKGTFNKYRVGAKQYWSPEMFNNLPYNGIQSDMYALGVILFILTFGSCPFFEAKVDDPYFSMLVKNPVDFWRNHPETSRRIQKNSVSSDLIKLLNFMLCPYPQMRLNIDEIRKQPWFVQHLSSENNYFLGVGPEENSSVTLRESSDILDIQNE